MRRTILVAAALLPAAFVLAGCGGPKLAARVNKQQITEEQFNKRVQDVNGNELMTSAQMGGPTRAGDYAMQALISDALLEQLGAEKKALPTEEQITEFVACSKAFPGILMPNDPKRTDADARREARKSLILLDLAKQPLNLTPADVQKAYDAIKGRLTKPDMYHVRVIVVKTPAKAQTALAALAKGTDFGTVSFTQSDDPNIKGRNGDIGPVPDRSGNPGLQDLIDRVKGLKPNEYTKQPFQLKTQAGQSSAYVIAQLVEKTPGTVPTLEQAKPAAEVFAVQQRDPGWQQRVQQLRADFIKKADITVELAPYKGVVEQMKKAATPGGAQPAG